MWEMNSEEEDSLKKNILVRMQIMTFYKNRYNQKTFKIKKNTGVIKEVISQTTAHHQI